MDRMRSRVIWELGALLKSVVLSCKKFSEVYEVHMVFSACEIFYSLLYMNVVGVRPILPFHLFVSLFFLLLFFYTVCSQTTVIWIGKYEFLNETEDCNPESYWVQNLVIFCKVAASIQQILYNSGRIPPGLKTTNQSADYRWFPLHYVWRILQNLVPIGFW